MKKKKHATAVPDCMTDSVFFRRSRQCFQLKFCTLKLELTGLNREYYMGAISVLTEFYLRIVDTE